MVQFWLDNLKFLINTQNFNFNNVSPSQKNIQMLNIIAMISLIVGLSLVFIKKKVIYFGGAVVIMALTILMKSNNYSPNSSSFENVNDISFDTGAYLVKNVNGNDSSGINNVLYINQILNFNKGDIIALSSNNLISETNIVSDIKYTT